MVCTNSEKVIYFSNTSQGGVMVETIRREVFIHGIIDHASIESILTNLDHLTRLASESKDPPILTIVLPRESNLHRILNKNERVSERLVEWMIAARLSWSEVEIKLFCSLTPAETLAGKKLRSPVETIVFSP